MLQDDVAHILIPEAQLRQRVRELGAQISADYDGSSSLLLLCVLKGSVVFVSDLMRQITIPHAIDFMATSSYAGTESTGVVRILKDLEIPIADRDVLIVEDIIDTGRTLSYLTNLLRARNPASLRICTLLDKRVRREVNIDVDYVGFEIPNEFVVGYGLDFDEVYRNLPFIGILKPEIYV